MRRAAQRQPLQAACATRVFLLEHACSPGLHEPLVSTAFQQQHAAVQRPMHLPARRSTRPRTCPAARPPCHTRAMCRPPRRHPGAHILTYQFGTAKEEKERVSLGLKRADELRVRCCVLVWRARIARWRAAAAGRCWMRRSAGRTHAPALHLACTCLLTLVAHTKPPLVALFQRTQCNASRNATLRAT